MMPSYNTKLKRFTRNPKLFTTPPSMPVAQMRSTLPSFDMQCTPQYELLIKQVSWLTSPGIFTTINHSIGLVHTTLFDGTNTLRHSHLNT